MSTQQETSTNMQKQNTISSPTSDHHMDNKDWNPKFNFKVYKYKIEDHFARKCYKQMLANSRRKNTREIGTQMDKIRANINGSPGQIKGTNIADDTESYDSDINEMSIS